MTRPSQETEISKKKKMLITGGTVFVSRYAAEYFAQKDWQVFVLNRGNYPQPSNVTFLKGDRNNLGDTLRSYHFDAILDITAYTAEDVNSLLDAVESYGNYIFISSSAVYPEYEKQPFTEETPVAKNYFWGTYGTDKIAAENALLKRNPHAYILRPPYLYGPGNNIYREAFVFDCALTGRPFYLPRSGELRLQFFHVEDLCRFMEILLETKPNRNVFNVGNPRTISVADWVKLCYRIVGKEAQFISVDETVEQRKYFCFSDYEYRLDISKQEKLMPCTRDFEEGLRESLEWYQAHSDEVERRPYLDYIDQNFIIR